MSLMKKAVVDSTIADGKDSVGGGGVLDSGIYPARITLAYEKAATSGAVALVIHAKTSEGRDIRSTQYVMSGNAKGNKNFYEKDGVKHYLPGYELVRQLSLLTTGKEVDALDTEEKVANLYDFDAKAEVPTKVAMVMELIGKEVQIALIKQTVDKNVKDASGNYVPSGVTREENEVDKFFRTGDSLTVAEIRAGITEAAFAKTWNEKWAGNTRDKSTKTAGTAGAPAAASAPVGKPKNSLFAIPGA